MRQSYVTKGLFALSLMLLSSFALAQASVGAKDLARQRDVNAALDGLCNDVNNKTLSNINPDEYNYEYERKFYVAAGVNFKRDNLVEASAKLKTLWEENSALFVCSSTNFSVPNGDLLKYAIETRSFGLVEDAMGPWHLDLNRIDPADCRTLLDFVELKLIQNHGTHLEPILRGYATRLRQAGAKRASEISPADQELQITRWQKSAARLRAVGVPVPEWKRTCR